MYQQEMIPVQQPPPQIGVPIQQYPPSGYPVQNYPPQNYIQPLPNYNGQLYQAVPVPGVINSVQLSSNANGERYPKQIQCFGCKKIITTRVENQVGGWTYFNGVFISLFCVCLFWIPCCMDDCKDKYHYCNSCGTLVGIRQYKLIG